MKKYRKCTIEHKKFQREGKKKKRMKQKGKKKGVSFLQVQASVGQFFAFMPNLLVLVLK